METHRILDKNSDEYKAYLQCAVAVMKCAHVFSTEVIFNTLVNLATKMAVENIPKSQYLKIIDISWDHINTEINTLKQTQNIPIARSKISSVKLKRKK